MVTRPPRPFPWKGAKRRRQQRASPSAGPSSATLAEGMQTDLPAAPSIPAATSASGLEPASRLLRRERHVGLESQLGVRGIGGRAERQRQPEDEPHRRHAARTHRESQRARRCGTRRRPSGGQGGKERRHTYAPMKGTTGKSWCCNVRRRWLVRSRGEVKFASGLCSGLAHGLAKPKPHD